MVRSSPASIAEASPWVAWPSTAWAETSSLAASPDFTPGNQRASRSDDRQGSARKGLGFPSPFFGTCRQRKPALPRFLSRLLDGCKVPRGHDFFAADGRTHEQEAGRRARKQRAAEASNQRGAQP